MRTIKLNNTVPTGLVDQVAADDGTGTEHLARRILVLRAAGRVTTEVLASLAALQNSDGGFGGDAMYASNVLDTAWALSALSSSGADASVGAAAVHFLLASQRSSGAFGFSAGPDDVGLTSQAVAALQASGNGVSADVDRAIAWLRARQGGNGGFGTVLDSSLAQLALAGANSDAGVLGMNRSYLVAQQSAEGSWGGDLYITAVTLRALLATGAGSGMGSVTGMVRDGATGVALAASAALDAGGAVGVDASGRFTFTGVKPGAHVLAVSAPGFAAVQLTFDVRADTLRDLGTIALAAAPSTGAVSGIVRTTGGAPLAGVALRISGTATASTFTAADGRYRLAGLTPGAVNIVAAKSGYDSVLADATVQAGSEVDFSPALKTAAGSARVLGLVTVSTTGAPLAGATVTVAGQAAVTAADGRFSIGGLAAGTLAMQLTAPSYVARSLSLVIDTLADYNLPAIALSKTAPPGTTGSVSGVVTAKADGAPLAGVAVTVAGSATLTASTGADGSYRIDGVAPGAITIGATRTGFASAGGTATVQAGAAILFSPRLDAVSAPGVQLTLVDSESGAPVAQASGMLDAQTQAGNVAGSVVFVSVPSGNHTLMLSAAGYATRRMPVQTDGATSLDLKTITLARSGMLLPLAGKVTDSATGKPVAGAAVAIVGTGSRTVTAADGSYRIDSLAQGDITVRYSATGYIGDTMIYTLSPYSSAAQNHVLVAGQAGALTLALAADATHYPAYAPVAVSARLENQGAAATDVRIVVIVQDGVGNYITSAPATWRDQAGTAQAVFRLQPGPVSVPLAWNTLAYPPGSYRIVVRVSQVLASDVDSMPVQLAEQRVAFDIDPTQALGTVRIVPMPAYSTVGAVEQLGYRIDVENRSNVAVASSLAWRLAAPDATLVDSGLAVLTLAPAEATQSRVLTGAQYRFAASGVHTATLAPASGVVPAQLATGSVEVAPATNVTPSMMVVPATIVPDPDQRVHIDLRLHGVEQK
ncbi:MAG TPA: carboxypeptidase regulatory-like domain-containing protein [Telluria sp.]